MHCSRRTLRLVSGDALEKIFPTGRMGTCLSGPFPFGRKSMCRVHVYSKSLVEKKEVRYRARESV